MKILKILFLAPLFGLAHCTQQNVESVSEAQATADSRPHSDSQNPQLAFAENNGSIQLPEGFRATVFADKLGNVRHITVKENGDVYARLGSESWGKSIVALRDTNGDGQSDRQETFGKSGKGTGIKIHKGYLYFATDSKVIRKKFQGDELVPSGESELILTMPEQSQHAAKPLAFDGAGNLYVNIGAPSNSCQEDDRTKGSPGQDPCPLLEATSGIWQYSDSELNQQHSPENRYATGIRQAVGITWNAATNSLFVMNHGRDQLHAHWPEHFSQQESAELPAEQMLEVFEGDDFGWPYCYYDHRKNQKLLNPEYGGNGEKIGRCAEKKDPVIAFPGHWAPNAITFYDENSFPEKYRNGAFIAFHGSWNRAPLPQQGYKVVFVPFENGKPSGGYEDFATQFAGDGTEPIESPSDAEYRPCGLAVGADGSLFISDSMRGRIWKVVYE